jgi:hypothetical protein
MHPKKRDDESRYINLMLKAWVIMRIIFTLVLMVISSIASASLSYFENVTVDKVTQWESDGAIAFTLSSGYTCYSPASEKNMYGLILSLYATKNQADIHCYEAVEIMNGMGVQKLHRIVAK